VSVSARPWAKLTCGCLGDSTLAAEAVAAASAVAPAAALAVAPAVLLAVAAARPSAEPSLGVLGDSPGGGLGDSSIGSSIKECRCLCCTGCRLIGRCCMLRGPCMNPAVASAAKCCCWAGGGPCCCSSCGALSTSEGWSRDSADTGPT
jgi:hypothetical protein